MVALIGRKIPTTGAQGYQAGGLGNVFDRLARVVADPLTPAIKREYLVEKNRQNYGTESLAGMFGGGDIDPAAATKAAILAGVPAANLGGYNLFSTTVRHGENSPEYSRAFAATPGLNWRSSVTGAREQTDAELANRIAIEGARPYSALVGGQPTTVTQERATREGLPPVLELNKAKGAYAARAMQQPGGFAGLTPAERAFTGAEPKINGLYQTDKGPVVWTGEGFQDPNNGAPVTGVTTVGKLRATEAGAFGNVSARDLFKANVATKQAVLAIDTLDKALEQSDSDQALGWLGRGARLFTDLQSQTKAALKLLRPAGSDSAVIQQSEAAINDVMNSPQVQSVAEKLRNLGVDNTVLRSQIIDLAFLVAKSQNPDGRIGRDDFNNALETIGGSIQDPRSMRAVLQSVKTGVVQRYQAHEAAYNEARQKGHVSPIDSGAASPGQSLKEKYGLE